MFCMSDEIVIDRTSRGVRRLAPIALALLVTSLLPGCEDKKAAQIPVQTVSPESSKSVIEIIQGHFPRHDVKETTTLSELGADELDIVELVLAFEDEYDITISEEQLDKHLKFTASVGQITQFVGSLRP